MKRVHELDARGTDHSIHDVMKAVVVYRSGYRVGLRWATHSPDFVNFI